MTLTPGPTTGAGSSNHGAAPDEVVHVQRLLLGAAVHLSEAGTVRLVAADVLRAVVALQSDPGGGLALHTKGPSAGAAPAALIHAGRGRFCLGALPAHERAQSALCLGSTCSLAKQRRRAPLPLAHARAVLAPLACTGQAMLPEAYAQAAFSALACPAVCLRGDLAGTMQEATSLREASTPSERMLLRCTALLICTGGLDCSAGIMLARAPASTGGFSFALDTGMASDCQGKHSGAHLLIMASLQQMSCRSLSPQCSG